MIPAILKGDTPQPINIIVPDDLAMLTVWYQGTSYDFMDVTSGDTLQLQFPRDNSFKIGTYPLIFVGVGSDGSVRSYPISAKVKITDCPGDVYAVPPIELGSGLIHASDLVPGDSMSDIKATVNRILSYLRRGAVCVVASAVAMCCADVEPLYTTLNDLPGNALVMTNVAEYVQDKAGSGGSSSGTSNYNDMTNKPSLNGVVIEGSKWSREYGLAEYQNLQNVQTSLDQHLGDFEGFLGYVDSELATKEELSTMQQTQVTPLQNDVDNISGIVRILEERKTITAHETNSELRIFHGDTFSSMRIEPPKSTNTIPVNQWRALELGDEKTVSKTRYHETDKLLVGSPRDLYFIDRIEVNGATTNYVLKSFQSYLDALSPDAVGDLLGHYLPTNGGGTVTGELNVRGNLFVSGEVSMPNLVNVRTANIFANGFMVTNGVVMASSGLMVSNGICRINGAVSEGLVQVKNIHVMDGGDVTFGGSPENPTAGMREMISSLTLAKLTELGFSGNSTAEIGMTDGAFIDVTTDRFARLTDIVSHASPNCVRPRGDNVSVGGTHASITLRNWCLNVLTDSLSATEEIRVFYPLHEIKGNLDMTQRLSFGIYFSSTPAETVSVKWDYAPDDGGFELRGETGNELDSISAGDYIWFQQIGPNTLSVTRKNFSNTINPIVND